MKKMYGIFFIIMCAVLIAACGRNNESASGHSSKKSEISSIETRIILNDKKWPENEYTNNISQPNAGKVADGWIDTEKKYCYIELKDINQLETEDYINILKKAGFKKVDKVVEKINDEDSVGILLKKGDISLSISYTDDLLCMYINRNCQDTCQ